MIPYRRNLLPTECPCGFRVLQGKGYWLDDAVKCSRCALSTSRSEGLRGRVQATYGPDAWTVSDYQASGAGFLAARWSALLSDRMGLGKTAQALLAVPERAPVAIVCPAGVKSVWEREIALWRPEYRTRVLSGRGSWDPPEANEVVILNYAILPALRAPCLTCEHNEKDHTQSAGCKVGPCPCPRFEGHLPPKEVAAEELGVNPGTVLIPDEIHKAKNLASTQTRRLRYLVRACERVFGLSASPIMNHPRELRAIYKVLEVYEVAFPHGDREFKRLTEFYDEAERAGKAITTEFVARRGRVELGRTAEEVGLELPPLRFETRRVSITAESRALIEEALSRALAKRRAMREVESGVCKPEDVEERVRLLMLVSHTDEEVQELLDAVVENKEWDEIAGELAALRKALALAKIPAALAFADEVRDAGEPLVAFSSHVAPVEALAGRKGWGNLRKASRRKQTIEDFQAGKLAGVAGTIRGSSEGITLTRARFFLFVDQDWTPEANIQALKRIHRRGQLRACLVVLLMADHPVDVYVQEANKRKLNMIEDLSNKKPVTAQ